MKLTDLKPQFYRYDRRMAEVDTVIGDPETWRARGCPSERIAKFVDYRIPVGMLTESQCIWFICPKCSQVGILGCHYIEVTFADRGVLPGQGMKNRRGEDVRWAVSGSDYSDLTTTPSILLEGGCEWHGFITGGEIK